MTNPPPAPHTIERLSEAGFFSLAMLAGMQLDVFTLLKDGPITAEEIAAALNVSDEKLKPLLFALVAAGLIDLEGDLFTNTPESDHYLVSGRPDYVGWHHRELANNWSQIFNTAESIRTGVPQAKIDYSSMSPEEFEAFLSRRHPIAIETGHDLISRYDFSSYRNMADVGGGSGGLSLVITEAYPHIKATVVELSTVTPFTQRYVQEAHATDRVQVVAADVTQDSLIGSFDVAVLSAFIQVLSPDKASKALKNIGKVIEPGGAMYIIGAGVLDDSRVSPPDALRYGLAALNRFDEGRAYTEQEHRDWLAEAGFQGAQRVTRPDGISIICAHKI